VSRVCRGVCMRGCSPIVECRPVRYLLLLEAPKKVEAGGGGGLRSRAPDHYVRGALQQEWNLLLLLFKINIINIIRN
jgi:hypothetical protein